MINCLFERDQVNEIIKITLPSQSSLPFLLPVAGGRKEIPWDPSWAKGINSTPEVPLGSFHPDTDTHQWAAIHWTHHKTDNLNCFYFQEHLIAPASLVCPPWRRSWVLKSCPGEEPGSLLKPCWRVSALLTIAYECFGIASQRGGAEITMITLELSPEFLGGEGRNGDPRPAICADDLCLQTT